MCGKKLGNFQNPPNTAEFPRHLEGLIRGMEDIRGGATQDASPTGGRRRILRRLPFFQIVPPIAIFRIAIFRIADCHFSDCRLPFFGLPIAIFSRLFRRLPFFGLPIAIFPDCSADCHFSRLFRRLPFFRIVSCNVFAAGCRSYRDWEQLINWVF